MNIIQHTLCADWAMALINDDWSSYGDNEKMCIINWFEQHPELGACLSVDDDAHFGRCEAMQLNAMVATFHFPEVVQRYGKWRDTALDVAQEAMQPRWGLKQWVGGGLLLASGVVSFVVFMQLVSALLVTWGWVRG